MTLRLNDDDPSLTEIILGEDVLAVVSTQNAPDLGAIVLIGESSLGDMGFANLIAQGSA